MVNNYINNQDFTEKLDEWAKRCREAKEESKVKPKMSEELGENIMKICYNLANRSNFSGYTFKDEMISSAIFMCIRYAHNFDKTKSSNAFSYISTIAFREFVKIIRSRNNENKSMKAYVLDNYSCSDFAPEDRAYYENYLVNMAIKNSKESNTIVYDNGKE